MDKKTNLVMNYETRKLIISHVLHYLLLESRNEKETVSVFPYLWVMIRDRFESGVTRVVSLFDFDKFCRFVTLFHKNPPKS